jgi:predicted nucleic acid-binding protein
MIYLDSSILITYLYEEYDAVERFAQARRMFQAIRAGETEAAISFYALPELYGYVESHFPQEEANTTFRLSLVTLFEIPLTVLPYLKRTERSLWRHRIQLRDSSDEPHAAVALAHGCEAIITYDQHFQDVAELIPAYTPEEFLALPPQAEDDNAGSEREGGE